MRIENLSLEPPGSGRTALARFDARVSDEIVLRNWALRRNADGELRCSPPAMRDRGRPVSLSPQLYSRLHEAAIETYTATTGGPSAHDQLTCD